MPMRGRSSSLGEVSNFMERPPECQPRIRQRQMIKASMNKSLRNPVKIPEPAISTLAPAPSRASIWEDSGNISQGPGGSELVSNSRGTILGGFLESCFACKKRLAPDEDIFMYRDLRAFCSTECRDRQIMLDEKLEKPPVISTHKSTGLSPANCHLRLNAVKGRVGARFGRSAAS